MEPRPIPLSLTMAYSPCPNDTLLFHGVATGRLAAAGFDVSVHLHDVETLNRLALQGTYDISKLSFHAFLLVRDQYALLNTGAALGFGCGPLLVARQPLTREALRNCRVAVPGELTTAHLLLRLWAPEVREKRFVPYDQVLKLVQSGEVEAGILIHESRFVFREAGLTCVQDLGAWWEAETGQPIPLGCIAAKKSLGAATIAAFDARLRDAVLETRAHPAAAAAYIREHAIETDEQVIQQHIRMFVTDFSVDLCDTGRAAVDTLERLARRAGVIA